MTWPNGWSIRCCTASSCWTHDIGISGAGNIGRTLARLLTQAGHSVTREQSRAADA